MKKTLSIVAAAIVLSVVVASAAWMTNLNHHIQMRIPDGWNTEYKVIVGPENKQAHLIFANDAEDEKLTMVAAIASIELGDSIDLATFQKFLEEEVLGSPTVVSSEERGFNNMPGKLVIYDANFDGVPLRLECFFAKKSPYYYAIFTGTLKENFDKNKKKLDELLVTFQSVP